MATRICRTSSVRHRQTKLLTSCQMRSRSPTQTPSSPRRSCLTCRVSSTTRKCSMVRDSPMCSITRRSLLIKTLLVIWEPPESRRRLTELIRSRVRSMVCSSRTSSKQEWTCWTTHVLTITLSDRRRLKIHCVQLINRAQTPCSKAWGQASVIRSTASASSIRTLASLVSSCTKSTKAASRMIRTRSEGWMVTLRRTQTANIAAWSDEDTLSWDRDHVMMCCHWFNQRRWLSKIRTTYC